MKDLFEKFVEDTVEDNRAKHIKKLADESLAEERKRQKEKFLWWFIPQLIGMIIAVGISAVTIYWVAKDVAKRNRTQCLEYNGALLNACLQNCNLSTKISHMECEDFCERASCKGWTQ